MSARSAPAEPVRVLVVDDHALFRRGLGLVLESEDGIELVGEAGDGAAGLARAAELAPDVVLMDVRMPAMSGIDAARCMAEQVPAARVVMLTVSDDEEDLYEAIKVGAAGYLLKEISVEEVAGAVRSVMQGHTLISPSIAGKLLVEFTSLASQRDDRGAAVAPPRLTAREVEVLRLVARGLTDVEVAARLFLSPRTVSTHLRSIYGKLDVSSRTAAARFATEHGLV